MNELGAPLVRFNKFDNNADGKIDNMHLRIEFKGDPSNVRNVQVISTFDYSLQTLLQEEMIGMLHVSIDTPNGASTIITDGDLSLKQSAPVLIDSVKRTLYNTDPLDDYYSYSMLSILEFYNDRKGNIFGHFKHYCREDSV
jgi:hypothetical protein